jgi:uncharacterized protein YjiS (DUF1127 family)
MSRTPSAIGVEASRSEAASSMGGATFLRVARYLFRQLKIRRDERMLHELSDHLLKDIGISRSEIQYAVRNGR